MPYVNIYDGRIHTLNPPTLLAVPHTFDLMFAQYWKHPEFKSLAPEGTPCKSDTRGLLKRCPITASGIKLIGLGNGARVGARRRHQHVAALARSL